MEENTAEVAEETAADSQSEEQTEVDNSSEETTDNSSEEATKTEETTEEPKSKANERIRDLIKKLHDKDAEIEELRKVSTDIQGVNDGEVEIEPLFNSAVAKAKNELAQAQSSKEINEARTLLASQALRDFDYMNENVWQMEAQQLMNSNPKLDPYTAAQLVGEKINYLKGATEKKIAKQIKADKSLKDGAYTPTGTQPNKTDGFTPEDIANMSPIEYEKNKAKIFKQIGIKANL